MKCSVYCLNRKSKTTTREIQNDTKIQLVIKGMLCSSVDYKRHEC